VFRNNLEGHYGQIGAGYLFYSSFQEANLDRGVDCYVDFLGGVPSASHIKSEEHDMAHYLVHARVVLDVES
jgi:hypothetical protein